MNVGALLDLRGRHALVSGGRSGIGEAMAHARGAARAQVLRVARREAERVTATARLQTARTADDRLAKYFPGQRLERGEPVSV